jgi:quercetin dioxygenase-like cupin family protein
VKGLAIIEGEQSSIRDAHPVPGHGIEGTARYRLVSPDDSSLWMVRIDADAGSTLQLPTTKGDEAIYVLTGALAVDSERCPEGGTVVIESGARPRIDVVEDSALLHMGPRDPRGPTDGLNGPIQGSADHTHVVGPAGWLAVSDDHRDSRYYADSTCPTCRLTLLYTSRSSAYQSATHSHSVDELIHVLWGELQLGSHRVGRGDTLAIDADRRYGFRTPGGFGFLNYRADASQQTIDPAAPPILEGGLVHGFSPPDGPSSAR